MDVVLVGHMVKEVIRFQDGRTVGPVLGSPVAYGSLMARSLGAEVGVVSIVGSDMPGNLLDPLRVSGVNLDGLAMETGPVTTTTELVYDHDGNKEVRYTQKARPISLADIPANFFSAKAVSIATMDYDVPLEVIRQICRIRQFPPLLAVDLGGYGGAHARKDSSSEGRRLDATQELVSCFDVVRGSVEDCALLFGTEQVTDEVSQHKIVHSFLDWGAKIAVMTRGEKGALVGTPQGVLLIPTEPGEVIDTTGAGDVFLASFLVQFVQSGDVEQAMRFATAATTHVIERTGGAHPARMPSRAEVTARLNRTR